ncbi:MAG: nucleoside phosphorylase [Candidatus Ornithospirochaeta sp.]
MIDKAFRIERPLIEADMFYKKKADLDVVLITFSHKILSEAKAMEGSVTAAILSAASGEYEVVKLPVKDRNVGIIMSTVGAPACGGFMEDAHALTGARNFILFGSAGSLDREKTGGRYVVVTSAYRDEGLSYHYLPPQDYVEIRDWRVIQETMEENDVPFVLGRTWTTDAFYRETKSEMEERKKEGCLTVEMEIAGAAAVAEYHGWHFAAFLEGGDNLDGVEWEMGRLGDANHSSRKLLIAIEASRKLGIDKYTV